jgi:hypothetical protein
MQDWLRELLCIKWTLLTYVQEFKNLLKVLFLIIIFDDSQNHVY